jgi:hypothetical protein
MKTEYLITFDSKENICVELDQFKHLLMTNPSISFSAKTISYSKKPFPFSIAKGTLSDESIYYDVTISCDDDSLLIMYVGLLKDIRKICTKSSGRNIIVLNDGIGEKYSILAYPIIYALENSMRKLITKFMAISIGIDWADSTVPKEVIESIRSDGKKKEKSGLLFEVDFIQLSNFLFKQYSLNDSSKFLESIKAMKDDDTINVSEIKQYASFTNWEKYFEKKVNCESEYLKSKWEKIYEYRCKVAHCRGINQIEYDELKILSDDVSIKIQSALDSINDIQIAEDERENLAENISSAVNEKIAQFIKRYNQLASLLQRICNSVSGPNDIYFKHETNKTNIRMQIKYLNSNKGIIESKYVHDVENLQNIRNRIVHSFGLGDFTEAEIVDRINEIELLLVMLLSKDQNEYEKLKNVDLKRKNET